VDGTVIKVDDFALQERLGERSKSPRWAIATSSGAAGHERRARHPRAGRAHRRADARGGRRARARSAGVTIESVTLHNKDEIARLGVKGR
jgi:DNA ligase (NAD+)